MAAVCVSSLNSDLFSPSFRYILFFSFHFFISFFSWAIFHHVCNHLSRSLVFGAERWKKACFQSRDARAAKNYYFRFIYSFTLLCSGALFLVHSHTHPIHRWWAESEVRNDREKNNILIRHFSHLSTTTTTTNHRLAINKFSIAMVRTDQFFPLLCAHKLWISKVISDSLRSAWKVEHTDNLIFLHTSFAGFEQFFFAPLSRFLFYEVLRSNINWEIEKRPADFSFVPFYWD